MAELKELRERLETFFQVQAYGNSVSLEEISAEFSKEDLRKLVPEDFAVETADAAKAAGEIVQDGKAEKRDYGSQKALYNELEKLVKEDKLTRIKLDDKAGLGYLWKGPSKDEEKGKLSRLPIDQIRVDLSIQQRADGVNERTVAEYAEVADRLPPIRVFHSKDKEGADVYILSRGFHRIEAWKRAKFDVVPVEIFEGDREDAKVDAAGDNAAHGRRRTPADIEKSVRTLITSRRYKNASVASIAELVRISWAYSRKLITKIQREIQKLREERKARGEAVEEDEAPAETVVGKGGKEYPATIKPKATEAPAPATPAPSAETPPPEHKTGVFDRTGAEVSPEIAPVFMDTRLAEVLTNIRANLQFLKDLRTDYAWSSLDVKARTQIISEISDKLETLELSGPWAALQDGIQVDSGIKRRKWMTKAEYEKVAKKAAPKAGGGGKRKGKGNGPTPTEAVPVGANDGSAVPQSAA